MSHPERVLDADVRARLDEHLDAVERALTDAGVSRSERRSICDEVEVQACEMVWQRAKGEPTEQHMRAVLAELDDPEAYREAAETSGQVTAAPAPVAGSKVHPFALLALVLPAADVFLLFTPIHPKGEVPTYICFGVVTFLSIVFAALAIRDIRREPDRYFGIALAILGPLAIPLLIVNTGAIYNVSELDPWGIAEVQLKQEIARLQERVRQEHNARYGPDVPLPLALSESEKWTAENAPTLDLLNHVVVIGASLAFSVLVFLGLYRLCRPKNRNPATGPRVSPSCGKRGHG